MCRGNDVVCVVMELCQCKMRSVGVAELCELVALKQREVGFYLLD